MNNKQKAKKLGIDYTGMSPEELKIAIENKEAENTQPIVPPEAPSNEIPSNEVPVETPSEEVKETIENKEAEGDIAVIMNGKFEVRRYTVENHGENFVELANEFATKKGYQVKLIKE